MKDDDIFNDISVITIGTGTNEYENQLTYEGSLYAAVDGNKSYVIGTKAPNTWFMRTYKNGQGEMFFINDDENGIKQVAKDKCNIEFDMWQPINK